jgi:hypothetical protein
LVGTEYFEEAGYEVVIQEIIPPLLMGSDLKLD